MSAEIIALRNVISGVATEYPEHDARRILAHPVWGKINEVVRTAKPEILAPRGDKAPTVTKTEDAAKAESPKKGK